MSKKRKGKKMSVATKQPLAPLSSLCVPKKAKFVMDINGVNIYGTSVFNIYQVPDLALQIDVSGMSSLDAPIVTGNKAARALLPKTIFEQNIPVLLIDWRDGTAHSLDRNWWDTLIEEISNLPSGSSVAVCCVGGTGRTGTVLAILAGLSGQVGPVEDDPVKWIRDNYYDDAVETETQLWYIEDVTGLPVLVYPSEFCYQPVSAPHGTQVPVAQDWQQSQGTVTGPLGAPSFVGASDHTGS